MATQPTKIQTTKKIPDYNWLKIPKGAINFTQLPQWKEGGHQYKGMFDQLLADGYVVKDVSYSGSELVILFERK